MVGRLRPSIGPTSASYAYCPPAIMHTSLRALRSLRGERQVRSCASRSFRFALCALATINLAPRNAEVKTCAAQGCDAPTTRIYCVAHERRLARHGSAERRPPRGPRPFQGLCSVSGCGKVATKSGRCARHSGAPPTVRPLLSEADIMHSRANRNGPTPQQPAEWFETTPSTVAAIRGGRNWGHLRT